MMQPTQMCAPKSTTVVSTCLQNAELNKLTSMLANRRSCSSAAGSVGVGRTTCARANAAPQMGKAVNGLLIQTTGIQTALLAPRKAAKVRAMRVCPGMGSTMANMATETPKAMRCGVSVACRIFSRMNLRVRRTYRDTFAANPHFSYPFSRRKQVSKALRSGSSTI